MPSRSMSAINHSNLGHVIGSPNDVRRAGLRALLMAIALVMNATAVNSQVVHTDLDMADGEVHAVARSESTLYIGGDFRRLGPRTSNAVGLSSETGRSIRIPDVEGGFVDVIASDGAGGWYLGGGFHQVGGEPRNKLAHVRADGTVSAWDPSPGYDIYAITISGSTVYVGGHFVTIGSASRNHIAAIDAVTGLATPWNPNVGTVHSTSVDAIVVHEGVVYAGGDFGIFGSQQRNNLVAIDSVSGAILPWNPNANAPVRALKLNGDTFYTGGRFTMVGGQVRNRIAAIDAATGAVTPWDPAANAEVHALALSGSTIFAGGDFTEVGGELRGHVAALDSITGTATSWRADACCGYVDDMHVAGQVLYVGGSFDSIGGQVRQDLAALDVATGAVTSWDPATNGIVWAITADDSMVYAGGYFTLSGAEKRERIAAIDLETGHVTGWDPGANGTVRAMVVDGNTLFAGGSFDTLGGVRRRFVAVIDRNSGAPTAWNANANGSIRALALSGSTLYAGGTFSNIGGQPRTRIGAVDTGTGLATPWVSEADSTVRALAIDGAVVYAGGSFRNIGGQERSLVAALDATTGAVTAWDPSADGMDPDVYALVVDGPVVYVGGDFLTVGGQSRHSLAAIDVTTGLATSWNTSADKTIYTIALGGALPGASVVYVGGHIITGFDGISGGPSGWNPAVGGPINALLPIGDRVYAGGATGITAIAADRVTPTLLSLFQAEPAEGSIVLRWEFAAPERIEAAWLERAGDPSGTWWRLEVDIRAEGRAQAATDYAVEPGRSYWYRLAITLDGKTSRLGPIAARTDERPGSFALTNVVPSPTEASATIEFTVARESRVRLSVLDVQGRVVARLVDTTRRAGRHQAVWSGRIEHGPAPSGAYFVLYEAGGRRTVKRLIVSR